MNNAIWFDYDPLDETVEYVHLQSNDSSYSDQDRLYEIINREPKRVRYDDGWIAVHPPLQQTYNPTPNPTTFKPKKQPTFKPSKQPTTRLTASPSTAKPTESPTLKWWANATSPLPNRNKLKRQKQKRRKDEEEELLSKSNAIKNMINVYVIGLIEPDTFSKTLQMPNLLLIQKLSPYEISLMSFLKLIRTAAFDSDSINYSFLSQFIQMTMRIMIESKPTQIVFEETMEALQTEHKHLNKSKTSKSAWYYILQSADTSEGEPLIEPDEYAETAFVWFHFISISMQKLCDEICENVLTLINDGSRYMNEDKFPSDMMVNIVSFLAVKNKIKI